VTVVDHASTRPWSVDKKYVRNATFEWKEAYCINEETALIAIARRITTRARPAG
jgi:hypothetical protein